MLMSTRDRADRTTQDYTTMRIWTRTLQTLRLIAAARSLPMVDVLDELVNAEWRRLVDAGKVPGVRPAPPPPTPPDPATPE